MGSQSRYSAHFSLLYPPGGVAEFSAKIAQNDLEIIQAIVTTAAAGRIGVSLRGTNLLSRHDGADVAIEANSSVTVVGDAN